MRRYWLPGMPNVEADPGMTIGSWLESANYYVVNVASADSFEIQFASIDSVAPFFAATSNRTLSGCFETIVSVGEVAKSPRSVAWLLVKLYYAAFFAAHGHMRACGVSCANIDVLDAARIYDKAKLYGVVGNVSKFNSGQYLVKLDHATLKLSFSAINISGSHEALWGSYKGFIDNLILDLPNKIEIKQQREYVVDQLEKLRSILCLNGSNGGNFLSKFRNSAQYRHSYGAWYPYTLNKSIPPKLIEKTFSHFSKEPDINSVFISSKKADRDLQAFCQCAIFLSALARGTVIDLSRRSINRKSIARRGAISFLHLCELGESG